MIDAHGGKLITKILTREESKREIRKSYKRIKICWDLLLDLEKIATGAYSPLRGFMGRDELESVIYNMKLVNGLPWTIPIFLSLEKDIADSLSRNEKVIICQENWREVGLLKVEDVFSFNKFKWAKQVYGTESRKHPGVKRLFDAHDKLIAGEVWMINKPDFEFQKYNLTPAQTRAIIKERGWKTVAGFQTRNVPHMAHEYLQKLALTLTDGILLHPIIGWKKKGDFNPQVIIKAYKALIKYYYPKESTIFAGLATAMRYAGPREAVFHALIRKNYGCTHFIVGRDHAGVGDFYDKYEAHRIFDRLPELGIRPLCLTGPYHCKKCGTTVNEKICPHPQEYHIQISGTRIRKLLSQKKAIPPELIRPEVEAILRSYGKNAFCKG